MGVIDDSAEVIRIQRPWGAIVITNNEVTIESHVDDPPAFRLHSGSESLGKVSFAKVRADGRVDELVLIQGKKDERTRGREDVPYGELTVHVKGPLRHPDDDGMRPTFLMLHDYTWVKNLDLGPSPTPPWIELPPPTEQPPVDEWLTPESQAKRAIEITRLREEMHPTPLDDGRVAAYMSGRNRNLAEVHDDELLRSGKQPDPCGGANRHPVA
jgi:hypothetical protein